MNQPIPPKLRQLDSQTKIVQTPAPPQQQEKRAATTDRIKELSNFGKYNIRDLVKDAEVLGKKLKDEKLKTNQIRKFLDAINIVKTKLLVEIDLKVQGKDRFDKIEIDIVLLKPKLAYAAARQEAAKPLQEVLDLAIDRVKSMDDFERLVQFIESIVAYHKAAGGE